MDRLSFFRGNRERAARLQLFPGRFPPPFPFPFTEKIWNHPFADLLRGRFSIEAFQNVSNQRNRIVFGQFLGRREIACLAREKMFRRNYGEIFGGVLQLHRVPLFAGEIDHDLIEKKIPFGDTTEPPTFVQAKRPGLERIELLSCF